MAALRIAVLVALGRNPVSGAPRPNPDDLLALEVANRLGGSVTLFHAGATEDAVLADYFAYGARHLELVAIEGEDVSAALARHLATFHLVLTGSRAEGGEGSGMVPYLVAEHLGRPMIGQVLDLAVSDGQIDVTQSLPKGQRRRVQVDLPAVIAIHPKAPVKPRFAFARRGLGSVVRHPAEIAGVSPIVWQTEPALKRPVKFRAAETKSGHARMLSAVAAETKGGAVISAGTPAEKAQAILAYLREHKLIEW